jgi:TolB-like protein/DNA-binding winged helix-turn-helix (wHTH) protein/Tfp pilus assembly protein PilF
MLAVNNQERIHLFNEFTLDLARGCVTRSGQEIHLRPQTYEVLKCLVESRGRLISKDKLIEEVWKGRAVTDGSLGKCIEELRDALGPKAKEFIRNVRGRGYIFDTGVEEPAEHRALSSRSEQIDVVRVTVEDQEEFSDATQSKPRPALITTRDSSSRLRAIIVMAGAALFLAIATFVGYRLLAKRAVATAAITSIAVVPFKNESGNPDLEYLSDGMTESLINTVSQLPQVSVKARSTVFRYKGQPHDPQRIASELSVQAIVEGRVVQRGEDLTLYLSLVDGGTGNQIWGRQYDRKLADLVSLQSEIARDVSHQLRARLSAGDEQKLAKKYTENVEAYQLYLRGMFHVRKMKPQQVTTGIGLFEQAIKHDSSYALAYVGLSNAYRALALSSGELRPTEFLSKAKAEANKAIELDDSLGEAHSSLSANTFWYDWDWRAAEKQCKRALELDSKHPGAHSACAHVFLITGRQTEALAEIKRARELEPTETRINALEGMFLNYAGQTDQALARLQNAFDLDPNFWLAHVFASSAYIDKGMFAEAAAEARTATELSGASTFPSALLGYALAKLGKKAEAEALLKDLLKAANERYIPPYHIALVFNGLGEHDKALEWLERGFEQRDTKMVFLGVEGKWNNLRSDPRFQDLMRRVGLSS